jgi:hypothetical protein
MCTAQLSWRCAAQPTDQGTCSGLCYELQVGSCAFAILTRCSHCCCCFCCRAPIFVSETGVSDSRHELRARCINSYYDEVGACACVSTDEICADNTVSEMSDKYAGNAASCSSLGRLHHLYQQL